MRAPSHHTSPDFATWRSENTKKKKAWEGPEALWVRWRRGAYWWISWISDAHRRPAPRWARTSCVFRRMASWRRFCLSYV